MPLTREQLTAIQADPDVSYWLEPLRIVKGNQMNLVAAMSRAGAASTGIAQLSVRFDLSVQNNAPSRPESFPAPDGPVRGILAGTDHTDTESAALATTLNADAGVVKALQLCELTAYEIMTARAAIVAGAAKLAIAEAAVLEYGLVFDLNYIAGVGIWAKCTHANCPGVRIC